MSDTPRTDKHVNDIGADGLADGEFARQLERELAEQTTRAALAVINAHKKYEKRLAADLDTMRCEYTLNLALIAKERDESRGYAVHIGKLLRHAREYVPDAGFALPLLAAIDEALSQSTDHDTTTQRAHRKLAEPDAKGAEEVAPAAQTLVQSPASDPQRSGPKEEECLENADRVMPEVLGVWREVGSRTVQVRFKFITSEEQLERLRRHIMALNRDENQMNSEIPTPPAKCAPSCTDKGRAARAVGPGDEGQPLIWLNEAAIHFESFPGGRDGNGMALLYRAIAALRDGPSSRGQEDDGAVPQAPQPFSQGGEDGSSSHNDALEAMCKVAFMLRKAGATLPAPEVTGTIQGSILTGLSIALCLVETELEAIFGGEKKMRAAIAEQQNPNPAGHFQAEPSLDWTEGSGPVGLGPLLDLASAVFNDLEDGAITAAKNKLRAVICSNENPASVSELSAIERFALLVLDEHRNDGEPGDVDGGWLQERAAELGLIVGTVVQEDYCCTPELGCPCDVGDICYRYSPDILKMMSVFVRERESKRLAVSVKKEG